MCKLKLAALFLIYGAAGVISPECKILTFTFLNLVGRVYKQLPSLKPNTFGGAKTDGTTLCFIVPLLSVLFLVKICLELFL